MKNILAAIFTSIFCLVRLAEGQDVETVSIAFVVPNRNLTAPELRNQLREYLLPPSSNYRLQVNPVYASGSNVGEMAKNVFCSPASDGVNAVFILVDKAIQGDAGTKLANLVSLLANAAGIPTIIWSSSAFELEIDNRDSLYPHFLLAPSIRSQARALFAFLQTHTWQRFSLITSLASPGHEVFAHELHKLAERETIPSLNGRRSYMHEQHYLGSRLVRVVKLGTNWRRLVRKSLLAIRESDKTKFIVLYTTPEESQEIFVEARFLGMTSAEYNWVAAKPVLGDGDPKMQAMTFVPGTVVVSYDTSFSAQLDAIKAVTHIWSAAVRRLAQTPNVMFKRLSPANICGDKISSEWPAKNQFFDLIRQSTYPVDDGEKSKTLRFDEVGTMEINRVILLSLDGKTREWIKFGDWSRTKGLNLNMPELYHSLEEMEDSDSTLLRAVMLQEPPYMIYQAMDPETNQCPAMAVPCELSPMEHLRHINTQNRDIAASELDSSMASFNHSINDTWACCVGLCVDLLRRLAKDIGFRFKLFEVSDRKWGSVQTNDGQWNGLVQSLLLGKADMVMTSIKINKERSEAIDFSIPYLETGITMLVNVKSVATSATAFLEPFSVETWLVILVGLINLCAFSTFLFEYFSIFFQGRHHRHNLCAFSPLSSLWLSWSMLFKAVVKVDIPKSVSAKVVVCVWGMFCVIFASSYMANLAVFMITKEDFHDFTGLEDVRIKNPYSKNPPWKFATIGHGATETFLKQNYPVMYEYMRVFNKTTVDDGVQAVKNDELDAFIYDAKVLEFKSSRDKGCKLKTVGKWYATTGYAVGFPQGSKWNAIFNKQIINYQHSGFIQQLADFWLTGDCQRYKNQEMQKSYQLGLKNFMSAYLLLAFGVAFCMLLLVFEHIAFKYFRKPVASTRGAFLWDKVLQKLNVRYVTTPQRSKDICVSNKFSEQCHNCGGQGHYAIQCSSPQFLLTAQRRRFNSCNKRQLKNPDSNLEVDSNF